MDYYKHKSKGFIDDYFGDIGEPVKISASEYYLLKPLGYKLTKVPSGSSMQVVLTQALINAEISLNSSYAEKLFKEFLS